MVKSHLHEFQLEITQVQTFCGKIGLGTDRIIMARLLIFLIQNGKCVFNVDLCLMFEKVATLDFHRLGKVP